MQIYSLLFNFQKKYGMNLFFSLRFCVFLSCLCLIRPFHAPHFSISVAMLYSRLLLSGKTQKSTKIIPEAL